MPGDGEQESVARHLERLRIVREMTSEIAAELDLARVLDRLVNRGLELSSLDDGGVALQDPATGDWFAEVTVGFDPPLPRMLLPKGTGITWQVIEQRRTIAIDDYQSFPQALPQIVARGVRSVIATPIEFQGRLIGVLILETRREGRRFSDEDRELMAMLAAHAAIAIERARLYASLERRVAERTSELEMAGRQKDRFLAMLGHELRNPLAAAKSAAQVLRNRLGGTLDLEAAAALEVLERQLSSQVRIVDDLLDVSRITEGRIVLHPADVELVELCHRAIADHRDTAARCGVRLSFSPPGDPAWTRGDPVRLMQILGNLLGNALKFTPPGGAVTLAIAGEPSRVVLSVRDTGVGIDPALMPRLFEPFSQGLHQGDRNAGLGLGLALVKQLAQLHLGDVSAHSDGPGKGAELRVTLARIAAPPAQAPVEPAAPSARVAKRHLLLIEDDLDVARMLAEVLRMNGHEVSIAHTGTDGITAFGSLSPDAVICDLSLPGMSGYEVASALRTAGAKTLLVALTGFGGAGEARRSREAGFDFHFVKPVDPDELLRAIDARVASR